MIQKISAYQSSDGTAHPTLEAAQKHELHLLFTRDDPSRTPDSPWDVKEIVDWVVRNNGKVVDILTMKPNSLPKARKINGGTKKRAPKHIAAQTTMFTEPPAAPAA